MNDKLNRTPGKMQRGNAAESFYDVLMELIPRGKSNAISMKKLAELLDTTERHTRQIVHEARMAEKIIAGSNDGYYVPETDEEMIEYYRVAYSRSISGLAALKAVRRELRRRGIDVRNLEKR